MKITKYIGGLAVLSLLATASCSKDFLDRVPTHALSDAQAESSLEGITPIVQGLHTYLYAYNFGQYFGRGQHSLGTRLDMLSDDGINTVPAVYMGTYRWEDHRDPESELTTKTWTYYYEVILNANKALTSLDQLPDLDKSKENYQRLRANALAIRANAYFVLVQLYGKRYEPGKTNSQLGVVIFTESIVEPRQRSTVEEVYTLINKDLSEAMALLKPLEDSGKKNDIRYATACGLAARVALVQNNWAKAKEYATEVINKSGATLQSGEDLNTGFNDWSASEWIWAYKQASDQNFFFASYGASYSANMNGNGNGSLRFAVNRNLYDAMGAQDARRKWWVCLDQGDEIPSYGYSVYFRGGGSYKTANWEVTGQSVKMRTVGPGDSRMDYVLMRLAEMYYIKAEAEARLGDSATALQTLKTVMLTRDAAYAYDRTDDDLINEIIRNKRLDMWFEGLAFFEMKRLKRVPDRLAAKNFEILEAIKKGPEPQDEDNVRAETAVKTAKARNQGNNARNIATDVDSKHWEFAIPLEEIEANPTIKINPL